MNNYYETTANPSSVCNSAKRTPVKGRSGAIARMIVSVLLSALIVIGCFPELFECDNLWDGFLNLLIMFGGACLVSAVIWFVMKWFAVMVPRAFGWANAMWRAWIPLTVFGLVLKMYAWIIVFFFPIALGTGLGSAVCMGIVTLCVDAEVNFLLAAAFFLFPTALITVFAFLDICKIKNCYWKDELIRIIPSAAKFVK